MIIRGRGSEDIDFKDTDFILTMSSRSTYLININDTVRKYLPTLKSLEEIKHIQVYLESAVDTIGVVRLPEGVSVNLNGKIDVEVATKSGVKAAGEYKLYETCHGIVLSRVEKEKDIVCPKDPIGVEEKEKKFPYYVLVFVVIIVVLLVIVVVGLVVYVVHVIRIRKRNADLFKNGDEVVDSSAEAEQEDMNEKEENKEVAIESVAIEAPAVAETAAKDEELSKTSSKLSKTEDNKTSSESKSSDSASGNESSVSSSSSE